MYKLDGRNLAKSNAKRSKMTCRFELDIGPDTVESTVESNSTLDLKELSYSLQDLLLSSCFRVFGL